MLTATRFLMFAIWIQTTMACSTPSKQITLIPIWTAPSMRHNPRVHCSISPPHCYRVYKLTKPVWQQVLAACHVIPILTAWPISVTRTVTTTDCPTCWNLSVKPPMSIAMAELTTSLMPMATVWMISSRLNRSLPSTPMRTAFQMHWKSILTAMACPIWSNPAVLI